MTDEPQRAIIEEEDLWSWIDSDEQEPGEPAIEPTAVTAVMVVHDAAEWLPRQLLSLARLTPRPGRLIAVDTGSADNSSLLLSRAAAEGVLDAVLTLGPDITFGEAVNRALEGTRPDWIWLLHDDSAPRPDTLGRLLDGARQTDIVVPKLLEPKRRNYPETLSEVGIAMTRSGQSVSLVERGDIDQDQTEPRDVLGASTAGMLVRGETWRELDGIAPEVERHRDGVDLGWRANAIGYRVMTWPQAALTHRRAGHTGERPHERHPHEDDRLAALRVAGSRGATTFGLALASLGRTLGFLLAKSPAHAGAELRAFGRYLRSGQETRALRKRLPREDLTPAELVPGRFVPARQAIDRLGAGIMERYRDFADSGTSIDELTGDEFAGGQRSARVFNPIMVLVVVFALASIAAGRTLFSGDPVSGGGLLLPPGSLAAAWQAYLTGDAPWLGFAAAASVLGLGQPSWLTLLAVLMTPLLAALSALALLRWLGISTGGAVSIAAAWAGAAILLGLVTAGDITGMVLVVAVPWLVRSLLAVAHNDASGAERLRAPAVAAWWLLVVCVVWPAALLLATGGGIAWVVINRRRLVDVLFAVVPSWAFLGPWLPTLAVHPGRFLTGADPLAWPDFPPASWAMLAGRILPSGLPAWANVAFFAVLALVSLACLARLEGKLWLGVLIGVAAPLILGTVVSRVLVPVDGGSARILLSPWALAVVAALLLPVIFLAKEDALPRWGVPIALGAAAALALGVWGVIGFNGPVRPTPSVLPGYVGEVFTSTRDTRALLVDLSGGEVRWNVADARRPRWGTGESSLTGSFSEEFAGLAYSVASATVPENLADVLRSYGVSHVWVRGFDAEQRAALNNASGLVGSSADDESMVWSVGSLVSHAQLDTDGTLTPVSEGVIGPGGKGRTLVVAEPPDAAWSASVGGTALKRAENSDRLVFTVDEAEGALRLEPTPNYGRLVWHLACLAAIALFAAPTMGGATVARRGQE